MPLVPGSSTPISQSLISQPLSKPPTFSLWPRVGLFCLAFWACAHLSQHLSVPIFTYVTFWLPAGLYVAVLLLNPTRTWPWFMLAALLANVAFDLPNGTPFLTFIGFYCANTVEALVGAWLMRRLVAERPNLGNLKELLGLVVYSATLSTMVGALVGAATLVWSGMSPSFFASWKTWCGNEALAILLVAPFILCWFGRPVTTRPFSNPRAKIIEALALFMALVACTWHLLVENIGIMSPYMSQLLPFLLWAGLRFGLRGATVANLLLALLMAFLTTCYLKGLTPEQISTGAYVGVLQNYLAIAVVIALTPAIAIIERDRNLDQLRESEERFRILTEAAFEGIAISEDGRILDVNDQILMLFGYSRGELVGREITELVAPESRAAVAQAIRTGQECIQEHRLLRRDGSFFYAEARAKMFRSGGRVLRLTAVQDITGRKQAEATQMQLTQKLQLLLDSTGEGIYGIDLQGNCTFINRVGAEMVGYQPGELLGLNLHEVFHHHRADGSPYPVAECPVFKAVKDGIHARVDDEVFWRRDKKPFPVEYSSHPLIEAGTITGAVVTFADISQRRKLEDQLRQSQKMEAIGRLAGGVAHDFNNILAAMMMETELACLHPNLSAETRRSLNQLLTAAQRAANLTRQLIVFSRQQVIQTRSVDLNKLVTNLTTMLERLVGEDMHIVCRLHPQPAIVQADAGMLDQVLLNLVVNARDAMSAGGRIVIEITEKTVVEMEAHLIPDLLPGRYVCLRVSDTGGGIAPDNLSHIFEPFFTTKELGKGTGLGLATVFGIVKQHSGTIQVESELGRGSSFHVFLPAAETNAWPVVETPDDSPLQTMYGKETILLVEDEPSVRQLTQMTLKRHGYQVLEAANGVEALQVWAQHAGKIHLLLTDLVMPEGINGRELAAQLQQRQPALRVIFTSGYSADIAGRELELKTGQNFIPKPSPPSEILKTVRHCLDS